MPKFIFCFYVLKEYRSFLPKFMIFVKKTHTKTGGYQTLISKIYENCSYGNCEAIFCIYFKLNMSRQRI